MALNLLRKLREELYIVSEIEDFEDSIHNKRDNNEAVLKFLKISKTLRNKSENEIIDSFIPYLESDRVMAIKSLFFIRDKVSGFGERRVFKVIINYLAFNESEFFIEYLPLIQKYGRFDDYYSLFHTPLEKEVIKIFKNQISIDLNSKTPSTLGKWLKSENTSSKLSRNLAFRTRKLLGYTSQEYRLILSSLRKKIDIIERRLSLKEFKNIDYTKLSLDICLKYKNSFIKNDKHRYTSHINTYKKNQIHRLYKSEENVINQTPFNIIGLIIKNKNFMNDELKSIYNNLWNIVCNNYKDFFEDTYVIIAISDKSKEFRTEAYKVALSTVLFCNKLNSSIYKNYYIYFKNQPRFGKIKDGGVVEEIQNIDNIELSNYSDIENSLDLLLFTSIKKELSNSEIPKNIMIISDLDLEKKYKESNKIQLIKNKWAFSGYLVPKMKFWQIIDGEKDKSITRDLYSNIFAKGYSEEVFRSLLKNEVFTSEELTLKYLENNRYDDIF